MNKLLIVFGTTLFLGIVSFEPTAFANTSSSHARTCQNIPIAEPSGGATRIRLQAIERCNKGSQQFTKTHRRKMCQSASIAEPTGGATRVGIRAMNNC
ncbi:hypothetical protein B1A85_15975 [Chroococcidiopsis sp. TS-821]|nr:hypothetical protein Glo7428_5069 [Gloeocapsa sp. PCC 7428]PPS41967.1 hypothetical protein B1A85_15975 [Chroococcidiopsis sp. TS-821]